MKQSVNGHVFQLSKHGLKESIKRAMDKTAKLIKYEVPFSLTFKKGKKNKITARLSTRLRGQIIVGTGHGKSRVVALKNARKSLFSNYESVKKKYDQQFIRSSKASTEFSALTIEGVLKPLDISQDLPRDDRLRQNFIPPSS